MATREQDIIAVIKEQIERFGAGIMVTNVGTVIEVGDGIARIYGLGQAAYNELLQFPHDITGLALNLEEDNVGAVILGDCSKIKEGDEVKATGRVIEVPVGDALIGRVVDPLGRPLDGKGPIKTAKTRPVERVAPDVTKRAPVNTPVMTGIKAIDSMIPIGRGQRELIIGDRFTGKSAIVLDTIIAQKGQNLICIYVAIGQKTSKVAQAIASLEKFGAMEYTIIVAADSSDPAPLQYIAPYAGCAIGEEFMEQGKDALILYDDLYKHAWAYIYPNQCHFHHRWTDLSRTRFVQCRGASGHQCRIIRLPGRRFRSKESDETGRWKIETGARPISRIRSLCKVRQRGIG
jgi:F-type H+-transporting ATPase subunit alpha